MTNTLAPMIYVACLAAYNGGMLHGQWLDANQSEDELQAEVFDMLKQSPIDDAEEWAIHDYQDFGELSLSEHTGLAEVSNLAALLSEYGRPYSAFAAYFGTDYATGDRFEEAYEGPFDDRESFGRHIFDAFHASEMPENLHFYFDCELYARDLLINDYIECDAPSGFYVFRNL